jgi:lipid-A-disaccharide synthase
VSDAAKLLVVAGEASGDRAGAAVVRALREDPRVSSLGFGGTALAHEGTRLVGHLRETTAVGLTAPLRSARELARVFRALVAAARDERPNVALLVNYTELNMRLARELRPLGVRIVWYVAPQIWAWREGRAKTLRGLVDRLCVILPFEEDLWRAKGVDASYVGHPALETRGLPRDEARTVLSLTSRAKTRSPCCPGAALTRSCALLPAMLEAYERVRADRASVDGRVLLAPSLDDATLRVRARLAAKRHRSRSSTSTRPTGIGRVLAGVRRRDGRVGDRLSRVRDRRRRAGGRLPGRAS